MKKILKRLATGFLAFATIATALPTTAVHASEKQYWTESAERVGIVEKVMNDGSIGSTFNEGIMKVEGDTAYCVDINTNFKNGYKTRADASTRMSADQISDVALSLEYVKQYAQSHSELNYKQVYLLEQCVVWQRLSVHLGWQCDNVRASYDEISKAVQDEVYAGAKAFASENKGRYECGGYIYSGEGQDIGQFWAKLAVGNATLKKTSSNASITDGNGLYSIAGATYGVYSDKDCTKQLATLTTDNSGNTDTVEVKADTVYIKELSAPAGYKVDSTVYGTRISGIKADKGYIGHKSAKMMKRSKSIEARQQRAIEEKSLLLKNLETVGDLKIFPLLYFSDNLVTFSDVIPIFDGKDVCQPISFTVKQGERIALNGKNGSGKTSLLKLLIGQQIEHRGTVTIGSGMILSYVPQDISMLNGSLSEFAEANHIDESLFKTILRKMDFSRIQFEKKMEDFSAGQKKKVLIAKSLCEQANLYVWDEPLNYVDIYSRMQIENLIREFSPTMIFVEHDLAFTNTIATKTVYIESTPVQDRQGRLSEPRTRCAISRRYSPNGEKPRISAKSNILPPVNGTLRSISIAKQQLQQFYHSMMPVRCPAQPVLFMGKKIWRIIMKSSIRNEIKAQIIRAGYTMQEVVDLLHDEYGWSDSVSNFSGKLQRGSLRYREAVELADVLGYDLIWQKRRD